MIMRPKPAAATTTPTPPTTQPTVLMRAFCRAWATEVEVVSDDEGQAREVTGLLEGLGNYSMDKLDLAVTALAACDGYTAPSRWLEGRGPGELASDIGQLVDDEERWPTFLLLARHLHKLGLSGKSLERVLAQLLAVAMRAGDDDVVAIVLGLVPETVVWDILAFNLACHAATHDDRNGTLKWTKRSLDLGKSPSQFETDDDFQAWKSDPDWLALLTASA